MKRAQSNLVQSIAYGGKGSDNISPAKRLITSFIEDTMVDP